MCARLWICLLLAGFGLLLVSTRGGDLVVAAAPSGAVALDVYVNGPGQIVLTPADTFQAAAFEAGLCKDTDGQGSACRFGYGRGREVTLEAQADPAFPPGVIFEGWSDDRCPEGRVPVCKLTLTEDEDFVMALFSPQRVTPFPAVDPAETPYSITVQDGGADCHDVCTFPQNTTVTLVANGPNARWMPDRCDSTGGTAAAPTCTVLVNRYRLLGVAIGAAAFPEPVPPLYGDAPLRIVRAGSGSGRVTSQSPVLDCGNVCRHKGILGDLETLTAKPDTGSLFAGWGGRGACSGGIDGATCKAANGSTVTARFETIPAPTTDSSKLPPLPPGVVFKAQLGGKPSATGKGKGRVVRFTVVTNAPAIVVARLHRSGRTAAKKTWIVGVGSTTLRLKAPRAKRGLNTLGLTLLARKGRQTFQPKVRIRR